jgi:hypothetical protein
MLQVDNGPPNARTESESGWSGPFRFRVRFRVGFRVRFRFRVTRHKALSSRRLALLLPFALLLPLNLNLSLALLLPLLCSPPFARSVSALPLPVGSP